MGDACDLTDVLDLSKVIDVEGGEIVMDTSSKLIICHISIQYDFTHVVGLLQEVSWFELKCFQSHLHSSQSSILSHVLWGAIMADKKDEAVRDVVMRMASNDDVTVTYVVLGPAEKLQSAMEQIVCQEYGGAHQYLQKNLPDAAAKKDLPS